MYTQEQKKRVNPHQIPKHVAIIPDGNRRWAKKNFFKMETGHSKGAGAIMDTVDAGSAIGIKILTFYLFSTENWNRPKAEITALFWLLEKFLEEQRPRMIANGIRIHTIGDLTPFSDSVKRALEKTVTETADGKTIDVVFALNYGGRNDIARAFKKLLVDYDLGKVKNEEVNEEMVSRYLDTHKWPDPDLLIRTSGESRVSNFLLWQISYSEIYTTDVLWPDFSPSDLLQAVEVFGQRERRVGV